MGKRGGQLRRKYEGARVGGKCKCVYVQIVLEITSGIRIFLIWIPTHFFVVVSGRGGSDDYVFASKNICSALGSMVKVVAGGAR